MTVNNPITTAISIKRGAHPPPLTFLSGLCSGSGIEYFLNV